MQNVIFLQMPALPGAECYFLPMPAVPGCGIVHTWHRSSQPGTVGIGRKTTLSSPGTAGIGKNITLCIPGTEVVTAGIGRNITIHIPGTGRHSWHT